MEASSQIADVWGPDSEPDVVMTPAGGGGLLSGASVASKGYWKDVRVVGAEPAGPSNLPPVSASLRWRNKKLT